MGIYVGGRIGPVSAGTGMSDRQMGNCFGGLLIFGVIGLALFWAAPLVAILGLFLLVTWRRPQAGFVMLALGGLVTFFAWPTYVETLFHRDDIHDYVKTGAEDAVRLAREEGLRVETESAHAPTDPDQYDPYDDCTVIAQDPARWTEKDGVETIRFEVDCSEAE